ncbi:MAG: HAD family phosphatase [Candidatus Planktophila sp.]|nr:HAD family phosphatase [Candidatus Planktophila sp.]
MSNFFEAVFFDMDGLMVDSEPEWLKSETEVTAVFGYSWLEEDQVACLGGPLTKVGQYMFDKCGQQQSPQFFTQTLIDTQVARMRGNTPTMPGAIELVRELQLHGVKTALVSASPRNIVDAVLDNLGHDLFPFSISSDDVGVTKPDPECYLKAATMSGSEISKCLVFEDSITGITAAKASGAYLIAVPHLVSVTESLRVRVIKSLEQLSYSKLSQLKSDFSAAI